ncbi:dTMP kinase [Scatolibacter rhodanostii]|uniref:dTMP kinase n=1 Tax=Scatolibacter rhodanostii TaxID=2014781 RepID=UPI000C06A422|nr:deoxynucleoside kinase [Scatolibacter rhodanostii]
MLQNGKLVVIEGLDGSGKGTQTEMLVESLLQDKIAVRKISFPNYSSPSSSLVKMYLAGEFGQSASSVNPYAASAFYAVDRFASFHTDWKQNYESDALVIADRYVTSNMIYQLGKLPTNKWDEYIDWLEDFEYNKMELPKPDMVIFLDMPISVSQKLMSGRYQGDESRKDIHERDLNFLEESAVSARYAAQKLNWQVIHCADDNVPKSIESIHKEIKSKILTMFEKIGE